MAGSSSTLQVEEVIEHILKFANGTTLANAEAVCTNWKSIVTRLNKIYDIWRLCCEEEMSEDDLFDLLSHMYPRHWLPGNKHDICWRTVYKHWKQWNVMPKWIFVVRKLPINFGYDTMIFSIKSSGDWLFIGTQCCVVLYNIKTSFITEIMMTGAVVNIQPYVTNVQENVKDTYLPNLLPSDMMCRFEHDALILSIRHKPPFCVKLDLHTGSFSIEIFSSKEVLYKDKCLHLVRCFQILPCHCYEQSNFRVILKDMLNPPSWDLLILPRDIRGNNVPSFYSDCGYSSLNIDSDTDMMLVNYWKDKVCFAQSHLNYKKLTIINIEKCVSERKRINTNLDSIQTTNINIEDPYLLFNWHCKVTLAINKGFSELHVGNGRHKIYPLSEISNNLTTALFYLNMLFLGTDLGNVYMFRVSKPEDLLKLDLKNPTWTVKVCKEPIKGFEIMETKPRPMIICSCVKNIYMIEFLSV